MWFKGRSLGFGKSQSPKSRFVFQNRGHCPICDDEVEFRSDNEWLRDHYECSRCHSIPRERALMCAVEMFYPNWRSLQIHESSPCGRGASLKLKQECPGYIPSQFYQGFPRGAIHPDGFRCEDLANLTFENETVDLVITQDVMEHLLDPARAFAEIARTLKPGGAHILTVPLVNKSQPSKARARRDNEGDGAIIYLQPAEYHGNPISSDGSLVCTDWGYDICEFIFRASGLYTTIIYIDDISKGVRAELIEVLVSRKLPVGEL
jgi:hypothetical protein